MSLLDFWCLKILSIFVVTLLTEKSVIMEKFPSQDDFDYIADMIKVWQRKQTGKSKILQNRAKGIVKIGSYAPSASSFVENIDSSLLLSQAEPYYPSTYGLKDHSYESYHSPYELYSPPQVHSSYPSHHHHHGHHEHHDHSHKGHGSDHSYTTPASSVQVSPTARPVVQYVPVSVNPRREIRNQSVSPWMWPLLFVVIFPTLLGAILLPLALVFLTNIIFVLLMMRNTNNPLQNLNAANLIPTQTKVKPRGAFHPSYGLREEVVDQIYRMLIKSMKSYDDISENE